MRKHWMLCLISTVVACLYSISLQATDSTLVFTRRIVDPEGGAGDYGFGVILINDEAPGLNRAVGDPPKGEKANIGIVRGFRDISDQSRIGFLLTDRELADGYNQVASIDGRFKLSDNWITQMQLIGTESEPVSGGKSTTGYQRNIQLNRVGRMVNTHSHFIETSDDYRAELGFTNRFFKPDVSGIHNRLALNFFPDSPVIDSGDVTFFDVYLEDTDGERIYHQIGPNFNVKTTTNRFGIGYTDFQEILRPQDFSGIITRTEFNYENWQLSYANNTLNSLEFDIRYRWGTTLNVVPPAGSLPDVADLTRIDFNVLWRPIDRLRNDNTYLYTELESRNGNARIFSNEIIRSSWNYQFTKEWSLRFIAQYVETDAGPATRLKDDKSLNFDLLLRYVINPWSAFFLGYNSNQTNFDIIESEGERELIISNDLRKDGDQILVKFSYLFQR